MSNFKLVKKGDDFKYFRVVPNSKLTWENTQSFGWRGTFEYLIQKLRVVQDILIIRKIL